MTSPYSYASSHAAKSKNRTLIELIMQGLLVLTRHLIYGETSPNYFLCHEWSIRKKLMLHLLIYGKNEHKPTSCHVWSYLAYVRLRGPKRPNKGLGPLYVPL